MTYSCSDFADGLFNKLVAIGAITSEDADNEDLSDNPALQADFAMAGIDRLVNVQKALIHYRKAIEKLAVRQGFSLQDGVFCEADERAKRALYALKTTDGEGEGAALSGNGPQDDVVACVLEADSQTVREFLVQDLVGDYDTPDDVPEWTWIQQNASYCHVRNGQSGIWEFVLNLSITFDDVPKRFQHVLDLARLDGISYCIFHQGT